MMIIKCKWFPFAGYKAITIWPFIIVRSSAYWNFSEYDENHEKIHGAQQLEMLLLGAMLAVGLLLRGCGWWSLLALPLFFWWYGIEFLIRYVCYKFNWNKAYRNVAFEKEAYANQMYLDYLSERRLMEWIEYM